MNKILLPVLTFITHEKTGLATIAGVAVSAVYDGVKVGHVDWHSVGYLTAAAVLAFGKSLINGYLTKVLPDASPATPSKS